MEKIYDRINWHNNTDPAINESNLNRMDSAIDEIDNRVVNLSGLLVETVPEIQEYLEESEDLVERIETMTKNPPYIGANGNWYVFNTNTMQYEDSGIDASITVQIADITMLPYIDAPYVTNSGTNTDPVFHLYIPRAATISSVEKTQIVGNVDTYTMTLQDGSTFNFTVTNGTGSGDMKAVDYDPQGTVATAGGIIAYGDQRLEMGLIEGRGHTHEAQTSYNFMHIEGEGNSLNQGAKYSHVEGLGNTIDTVDTVHCEGQNNSVTGGSAPHAEGIWNTARGNAAHVEGINSYAMANAAHAEGAGTTANGTASHAEGNSTNASANYSHAEGSGTYTDANNAHAEGNVTTANGNAAHSEGYATYASGTNAHAEGSQTTAGGDYSHTEGRSCYIPSGCYGAHAEGSSSSATYEFAHAEGWHSLASGRNSHCEGMNSQATNQCAHAEGSGTTASGAYAHAEGCGNIASGQAAHATGMYNIASGNQSAAFGNSTTATGQFAAAFGRMSRAYGGCSMAIGFRGWTYPDNQGYAYNNHRYFAIGQPMAKDYDTVYNEMLVQSSEDAGDMSFGYNNFTVDKYGNTFMRGFPYMVKGVINNRLIAAGDYFVLEDGAAYVLWTNTRMANTGAWRGAQAYYIVSPFSPQQQGTGATTTALAVAQHHQFSSIGTAGLTLQKTTYQYTDENGHTAYHARIGIGSCVANCCVRYALIKVIGSELDMPTFGIIPEES